MNLSPMIKMGKPHVIAIPYPAQGHVIPMLELCQLLAANGVRVTFVNTEFNHGRVLGALSPESDGVRRLVEMVCIPDGMEAWEDRNELGRFTKVIFKVMPGELEKLIQRIDGSQEDKITCVVADWAIGWALAIAGKLGLKKAAFMPATAALLAVSLSIPKLISDGVVDGNGKILKEGTVKLSASMPAMCTKDFTWTCFQPDETKKIIFDVMKKNDHFSRSADWIICNSSTDLEPSAFSLFPKVLPIGPVLASNRRGKAVGHFWPEDSTCLAWLDHHPPNSVIYVAFGSFTVFDPVQFQELALGLELTNRPFLWVVRPDAPVKYPEGFEGRVSERGRMVGWAPQQQVLSHPAVACFLSHCGWNSTIEGVANGITFLCWPYFADQFINRMYICDEWEIGIELQKDEKGVIGREEIRDKVEQLLTDFRYKERARNLQEKVMDGVHKGCSYNNLCRFIEWIKG